jgi:hypothetical protein
MIFQTFFFLPSLFCQSAIEDLIRGGSVENISSLTYFTTEFDEKLNQIILPVHVNNSKTEYHFLFDTGASVTSIDRSVCNAANTEIIGNASISDSTNTSNTIEITKISQIQLGTFIVHDCGALIISIPPASDNKKIDGVIGTNILRFFVIKVDNENHKISFYQKNNEDMNDWRNIPIVYKDNFQLRTNLNIGNNEIVTSTIDTGCDSKYFILPRKQLDKLKKYFCSKVITSEGIVTSGAFGDSNGSISKISEMYIGDIEIDNPLLMFTDSEYGLIPNSFLSCFNYVIDYPNSVMKVKRVGWKDIDHDFNTFGYCTREKKVVGVWLDSPAWNNGIRVGVIIDEEKYLSGSKVKLTINGSDVILNKRDMLQE